MTDKTADMGDKRSAAGAAQTNWAWHPQLPLQGIPIFVWPPRLVPALKFLVSVGFLWSIIIPLGALATITWIYLQPALERCAEFHVDWILEMYARNLGIMVLVAGGLHLYFYTFKRQGSARKFDPRGMDKNSNKFFARNQVWDNMLWTCASGVTIWTAYEVFFMWAYANDMLPYYLEWTRHPVWFVLMFLAIPFWSSLHFYCIHRLLHWPPLYKFAHAVHHRNESIGPWSGMSMHPIEHVMYLSSVLIHVVLMSHPIHIFFHNQWNTVDAATTHTGFESLLFRGRPVYALGSFHHQLHHRFYNCNYGTQFMPWDKWFGTDHDGLPETMAAIRKRQRARLRTSKA